jgi:hypothetical protein
LADDEPFGPDWPGPDASLTVSLLQSAAQPLSDSALLAILAQVVRAWSLAPVPMPAERTASIAPQTRIVATGTGAVLALAERFQAGRGLDLSEQVLLVSSRPGERQLLGVAAALLAASGTPRLVMAGATVEGVRATGFLRADLLLASDDAAPEARATAEAIARELGA